MFGGLVETVHLIVEATIGVPGNGDIAIDDVSFTPQCRWGWFKTNYNVSQVPGWWLHHAALYSKTHHTPNNYNHNQSWKIHHRNTAQSHTTPHSKTIPLSRFIPQNQTTPHRNPQHPLPNLARPPTQQPCWCWSHWAWFWPLCWHASRKLWNRLVCLVVQINFDLWILGIDKWISTFYLQLPMVWCTFD